LPVRKPKIVPLENAEACQSIFNGLPFGLMVRALRHGLKTFENGGFCGCNLSWEFFAVKLLRVQIDTHAAILGKGAWEMVNLWLPYFKISLSFLSGVQLDFTGNRV